HPLRGVGALGRREDHAHQGGARRLSGPRPVGLLHDATAARRRDRRARLLLRGSRRVRAPPRRRRVRRVGRGLRPLVRDPARPARRRDRRRPRRPPRRRHPGRALDQAGVPGGRGRDLRRAAVARRPGSAPPRSWHGPRGPDPPPPRSRPPGAVRALRAGRLRLPDREPHPRRRVVRPPIDHHRRAPPQRARRVTAGALPLPAAATSLRGRVGTCTSPATPVGGGSSNEGPIPRGLASLAAPRFHVTACCRSAARRAARAATGAVARTTTPARAPLPPLADVAAGPLTPTSRPPARFGDASDALRRRLRHGGRHGARGRRRPRLRPRVVGPTFASRVRVDELCKKVTDYLPAAPVEVIKRAYEFSAEKHKNQKTATGEPYVSHPVEVAHIIADLKLDVPSVATGLAHDTVEDTLTTPGQLEAIFGTEIANLVDGVTKISQINFT